MRRSGDCAVYVGIMFSLFRRMSNLDVKMRNSELSSMFEKAEKSVQAHIGCALEKVLLQRVLVVVDTFFGMLKQCIVENFLVHVCISNEPAFKE